MLYGSNIVNRVINRLMGIRMDPGTYLESWVRIHVVWLVAQ